MGAVLTGDAAALKALYSTDPPAEVSVKTVKYGAEADINFWLGLKARSMKVDVIRNEPRHGHISFIFQAEVVSGSPDSQMLHITDDQSWKQQGEQWRLIAVPGRLIRHARHLVLRLPPGHGLLSEVLARLRALPVPA